ncbi:MAG: helix-turn-helix transcriptional regulator [Ruminococcaceae bacterium]|nr:helix-turn-helix transcriptional regulator [Oscillospiraceae bacterium]
MTNVGENIKKMRKKLKITQDELSEKLNVTRQAVSNWENGKTEPDIETLTKMAQIFDISIDELVDGIPKGIKELRGKKSHLYIGIAFTLFYILSSLTMILIEKMFQDYVTFTYDFFYSAFYVFVWKPLTVAFAGIGIPALISYISGLYIENKKLRIAFLVFGIIVSVCTSGFMIFQFLGLRIFNTLTALHSIFINYYVFLCEHTILHIFGAVLIFFGCAKK